MQVIIFILKDESDLFKLKNPNDIQGFINCM